MEKARTIISGNHVHRPLLDDTVTEEDWKKAEAELNETPETRAVALTVLKELLAEETDFTARTDDSYLLRFLRVRKFDVERAFNLIRDYYKFRVKNPGVFVLPTNIEKALRSNIFNYLPHRDHKGRAIFVIKMNRWNPIEVPWTDFVAAGNIFSEYVLDNTVTQINGYIGIWDLKGFSLKQFVPLCSLKNVFMTTSLMQDRFPGRFKVAYCINCSSLTVTAWNIVRKIMREKFRKRINILTSDMKELHKYVSPCILPVEFGGVLPSSDCTELAQSILNNEQYFSYNHKFGYNPNDLRGQ